MTHLSSFSISSCVLVLVGLGGCGGEELADPQVDCEVLIIGGGAGGLHTAYRLAPTLHEKVCLFEKEAVLGGRILDVSLDDDPTQPRVAVGARRVMEGQEVVFGLAEELDLTLETPPVPAELISVEGGFAFSSEELVSLYPGVTPSADGDTETALYDELRFGMERLNASSYPDFGSYVTAAVGPEGYDFLRDMTRFRADFEAPIDSESYLTWLDEEWDTCCTASYPVGGMSSFIEGMSAAAEAEGALIYLGEPALSVERVDGVFEVVTDAGSYRAAKLVIAVPPSGLDHIEGAVAEDIRAQQPYQDIYAVRVTTVAQWYEEPWWTEIVNPGADSDANVWRAWTTEHCLNSIEIPQEPYLASANVMRSVYNDDPACNDHWTQLESEGIAAIEASIHDGLTFLFNDNGVSEPTNVVIPQPISTRIHVWPDAWHWLAAGATSTNASVFEWSVEPLPGEEVSLVGEAYNPQRSAWSDAAFKSSIRVLEERFDVAPAQ